MKLFMVGDFSGNTGPSIANKTIKLGLKYEKEIIYSEAQNKVSRLIEIFYKTIIADKICMCSYTKSNLFIIKLANFLNKPTYYLMHGYGTYEVQINKNATKSQIKKVNNFEKEIFKNVNKIFCVSNLFMKLMQEAEPEYREKFSANYNGLDITKIKYRNRSKKKQKQKQKQVVSIGGGMPQKNNLEVCKAIRKLNEEKNMNLSYVVIGSNTIDKDEIVKYDFVTYIDKLPHEEVLDILEESYLYVQNSEFESFGLSVVEALLSNCNLIISNNIGVKEVIKTIEKRDLIINPKNIEEIANKIEVIMENGNGKRLRDGLDIGKIHYKNASYCLLNKIKNDVKQK